MMLIIRPAHQTASGRPRDTDDRVSLMRVGDITVGGTGKMVF